MPALLLFFLAAIAGGNGDSGDEGRRNDFHARRVSFATCFGLFEKSVSAAAPVYPKRPIPRRPQHTSTQAFSRFESNLVSRDAAQILAQQELREQSGDFHVTGSSMIQRVSWESEGDDGDGGDDEKTVPPPPQASGNAVANIEAFLRWDPENPPYDPPGEDATVTELIGRLHEKLDRSSESRERRETSGDATRPAETSPSRPPVLDIAQNPPHEAESTASENTNGDVTENTPDTDDARDLGATFEDDRKTEDSRRNDANDATEHRLAFSPETVQVPVADTTAADTPSGEVSGAASEEISGNAPNGIVPPYPHNPSAPANPHDTGAWPMVDHDMLPMGGQLAPERQTAFSPQGNTSSVYSGYAYPGYVYPAYAYPGYGQTTWGQDGAASPYPVPYGEGGYYYTNPYRSGGMYAGAAMTPGAYWGPGGFSQQAPGTSARRVSRDADEQESFSPLTDTFRETFGYFNPLKAPQGPDRGVGGPMKMRSWRDRPFYLGMFGGAMEGSMLIDRLVDQGCGATGGFYFGWYCDDYWGLEARLHFASLPDRETAYGKRMYEAWYVETFGETSYVPPLNQQSNSLTMFDVSVHYYPLGNAKWRPFLKFGLGAVSQRYKGFYGVSTTTDTFSIPWGVGVKYWWNERIAIQIDLVDNVVLSSNNLKTQNNVALTLGLDFSVGKNRRSKPKVVYWPQQGRAAW